MDGMDVIDTDQASLAWSGLSCLSIPSIRSIPILRFLDSFCFCLLGILWDYTGTR